MFKSTTNSITFFKSSAGFADACVVIFSFFGLRVLGGKTSGADFLLRSGYDVVSVESNVDDWHQGLPPPEVQKLALFLKTHYGIVHGYGSSMGAYAALAFAGVLGFSRVLAISPQFRIDQDFDSRWASNASKIKWQYDIQRVPGQVEIFMVFDPMNEDALHIPLIVSRFPSARIHQIPVRYSGHPSTFWLHRAGVLKDFMVGIFECGQVSLNLRLARINNMVHLRELGFVLFRRKRYPWSARVLEKAISGGETGAQIHKFLSGAQAQSGNMDSAIRNAEIAIGLAASTNEKAGCLLHLGHLFNHSGRRSEAIQRLDEAIQLVPSNLSFRNVRAHMERAGGSAGP